MFDLQMIRDPIEAFQSTVNGIYTLQTNLKNKNPNEDNMINTYNAEV